MKIVLIFLGPIISNLILLRLFWKVKGENEFFQTTFLCLRMLDASFVCWMCSVCVLYVKSFQRRYIILILPLRELKLRNWPTVTPLEIAEPESNPGLLSAKARALVHEGSRSRIM